MSDKAKEKLKAPLKQVFVLKMTAELAENLKNKSLGYAKLPREFAIGDRLLLREYNGANTGRADLCEVLGNLNGFTILRRGWCWYKDAPEDLACLSYALSPEHFPVRLDVEMAQ